MFYYFGRKGRLAASYPAPAYPLVIEPFAGSMAYALHWRPLFAIGVERDPDVHALWHRLCEMTAAEIEAFPTPQPGEQVTDLWPRLGIASGRSLFRTRTMNEFTRLQFARMRRLALRHHDYARRSVIYHLGDYRQAPDVEATWFVDPPYEGADSPYRSDDLDYRELAEWCLSRRGQVIVCEGPGATWLPFGDHGSNGSMLANGRAERVLVARSHRRCEMCPATFPTSRADSRYCSARCRQRARRAREARH